MLEDLKVGDKVLVTVDNWFLAPDGRNYRGVFGTLRSIRTAEDSLGVRPNARSTNWYMTIGNTTIAGCQVHYAVRTDKCSPEPASDWIMSPEHGLKEFTRPSSVYFADEYLHS